MSAMDGILVGRRERIHSGVLVGEYVDSCAPPQKSYLQLNPTIPSVDNDAYVVSSDVSLAGYICTHVCLFYIFAERLQSH